MTHDALFQLEKAQVVLSSEKRYKRVNFTVIAQTMPKPRLDPRVKRLCKLSKAGVRKVLRSEGADLPITRSLLDLLFNIVYVKSLPQSETQAIFFANNKALVERLLKYSTDRPPKWAKLIFETNTPLVYTIVDSCPTVGG